MKIEVGDKIMFAPKNPQDKKWYNNHINYLPMRNVVGIVSKTYNEEWNDKHHFVTISYTKGSVLSIKAHKSDTSCPPI